MFLNLKKKFKKGIPVDGSIPKYNNENTDLGNIATLNMKPYVSQQDSKVWWVWVKYCLIFKPISSLTTPNLKCPHWLESGNNSLSIKTGGTQQSKCLQWRRPAGQGGADTRPHVKATTTKAQWGDLTATYVWIGGVIGTNWSPESPSVHYWGGNDP